ncbi:hypothetical protein LO772_03215 [Yinghuangia sp. ASG 101]|uniref:hypothetical protein n=1 Tax=Yinghuangia sp. ASG 101 TaxID=2896848 RepID=UPI001E57A84C|nr:hypothetical protein [Yinghuangia sp. ASG 101]UGQ12642.1 hypothetical protein LO772_03215 [Yinghuangia sp. ASG 101]
MRTPQALRIYLGDHYAGSAAGLALVRRLARTRADTSDGPVLRQLEREIAEDRETLHDIMHALGVAPTRGKSVVGSLVGKAGRLKPNGRLRRRAPLSDLLELEALFLGVEGKAACWRSLRILAPTDTRLDADRLDELISRADGQVGVLEALRATAVARTLGAPPTASDWSAETGARTPGGTA